MVCSPRQIHFDPSTVPLLRGENAKFDRFPNPALVCDSARSSGTKTKLNTVAQLGLRLQTFAYPTAQKLFSKFNSTIDLIAVPLAQSKSWPTTLVDRGDRGGHIIFAPLTFRIPGPTNAFASRGTQNFCRETHPRVKTVTTSERLKRNGHI